MSVIIKTIRIGKRGEIVIPAEFRELFSLKYGTNLLISSSANGLNIQPKDFSNFKKKWQKSGKRKTLNLEIDDVDSEIKRENLLTQILKK
jgi:AbrB family looped-hinge helix DNA binding protein